MNSWRRFVRFNAVGLVGAGVQLGTLAALIHVAGIGYRIATPIALGLTLVHNFAWHARWTWSDRRFSPRGYAQAFLKFVSGNGGVSAAGMVVLMPLLVEVAGVQPVAANCLTIAICGLVNYWLAAWAFIYSSRTAALRQSPLRAEAE